MEATCTGSTGKSPHFLLVFDFDNTIINGNTDGEIIRAQRLLGKISSGMNYVTDSQGWSFTMSNALKELHENGSTPNEVCKIVTDIPLVDGMKDVFQVLEKFKGKHDIIMLSHSNTVFVDEILKFQMVEHVFDEIHTYKANWSEDGLLKVDPYTDEKKCPYCPSDFCKGKNIIYCNT